MKLITLIFVTILFIGCNKNEAITQAYKPPSAKDKDKQEQSSQSQTEKPTPSQRTNYYKITSATKDPQESDNLSTY